MKALKTIEKIDFSQQELNDEYSDCKFMYCDFSNQTISDVDFDSCVFEHCNLTMTRFRSNLREVKFIECKLTGADFTGIHRLSHSFSFEKSQLDYANFVGVKLRKTHFSDCRLLEVSFEEADISSSTFDKCELNRTSFYRTNLEKTDFSTAYNFSIHPTENNLKNAIFSSRDLAGLLSFLHITIKDVD